MNYAYRLNWTTVVNGVKKTARTHFGVTYTLNKHLNGTWAALVTVPSVRRGMGGTEILVDAVTFAEARKAAQDDATRNGGR